MKRAIKTHLRDFIAFGVLLLIGLGVGAYVLSNQRLYLPKWVPGIGTDFYNVNAEFSTAQAVVPGQGQTVDIAGVPVGELGEVNLKNGVATVQLKIRRKYAPIYKDAHMLLRPKTGLKDMIVEMDPGTKAAGALPEGGTIPVQNTAPDVNLDEILASLDTDTRDYLQILVTSGGQALSGPGTPAALRETFKRFEPTNRDLAKITGLLSLRRRNIAHVVHNFQLLATELGTRDTQLAQLVGSANANFRAFANQEASIRESLGLLPDTLNLTQNTLVKATRFSNQLGKTSQDLRPAARELGPALAASRPFLRITEPVIRTQLRPFARDVQPTARSLNVAAKNLEPLIPRLTKTFQFLNALLNTVAYNPPGSEEGFLFWGSWVNHAGATIFSTQDAHGPIRRGLVITSCASLGLLETITATNPALDTLFTLLNGPSSKAVCGTTIQKRGAKVSDNAGKPGPSSGSKAPTANDKGAKDYSQSHGPGLPPSVTPPKSVPQTGGAAAPQASAGGGG